jgi:hypothetical protein
MVSRLHSRLDKIEQQSAPIKAEQERKREAREKRERALALLKDPIEDSLSLSRYVHGDLPDEEEMIKDIVEMSIIYHHEATKRFGVDEGGKFKATPDQLKEISREAANRINLRFFTYSETVEQFNKTQEQWKQARADREAGVASADSEAAEYLRQLHKRHPRRRDAKRLYKLWE